MLSPGGLAVAAPPKQAYPGAQGPEPRMDALPRAHHRPPGQSSQEDGSDRLSKEAITKTVHPTLRESLNDKCLTSPFTVSAYVYLYVTYLFSAVNLPAGQGFCVALFVPVGQK